MKTKIIYQELRNSGKRFFRLGLPAFLLSLLILLSACTTTKTTGANGEVTTTTGIDQSAATQAAIGAGIQIATAAASAAIQTYLTAAPAVHARLAMNNPAINAAMRATETEVRKAEPILTPLQVHNIVSHAYAKALRNR